MGRIVALDFGKVRTGIAVTDELQLIASGLTTVPTKDLLSFLKEYLHTEKVDCFVIGEPKQMNGVPSESEDSIQNLIKRMEKLFPTIPIKRQDERFTSKLAIDAMITGGLKKKKRQDRAMVDKVSATLILQTYLERL